MLDLRRDLYARLVTSAQKNRALNQPFKKYTRLSESFSKHVAEKSAPNIVDKLPAQKIYPIAPLPQKNVVRKLSSSKIEEKVHDIVDNVQLKLIREEIEAAEIILRNIKNSGEDNPKVRIIEKNFYRLKALLDQKTYV